MSTWIDQKDLQGNFPPNLGLSTVMFLFKLIGIEKVNHYPTFLGRSCAQVSGPCIPSAKFPFQVILNVCESRVCVTDFKTMKTLSILYLRSIPG